MCSSRRRSGLLAHHKQGWINMDKDISAKNNNNTSVHCNPGYVKHLQHSRSTLKIWKPSLVQSVLSRKMFLSNLLKARKILRSKRLSLNHMSMSSQRRTLEEDMSMFSQRMFSWANRATIVLLWRRRIHNNDYVCSRSFINDGQQPMKSESLLEDQRTPKAIFSGISLPWTVPCTHGVSFSYQDASSSMPAGWLVQSLQKKKPHQV